MARYLALAFISAACVAVATLVATACITAPPPQLPQEVEHRPTILRESVQPPPDELLLDLHVEFEVPVVLEDPNETFQYDVFIDYSTCADPTTCQLTQLRTPPGVVTFTPSPATLDGGVVVIDFDPPTDLDPSQCHTIDFMVAHQFEPGLPHTPDSIGGDLVRWTYDPGGTVPCNLLVYDAGSVQDGAFPPSDAGAEALPAVPESGTD